MVLTGRGAEQHSKGTDTVSALINLALALGLPGTAGSGFGCLTGQGNGQGGREHGQKADQLPGYRRIDDPAAREHVAAVWGVDPARIPGPGRSAFELLDALGTPGGSRALLVMGSNVSVSAPSSGRIGRRLRSLDFLVVCDPFLSETAALADVVLPVAQWAEESGTMTNLEGRVLLRQRATCPPPGVWTDLEVIAALARLLGAPGQWDAEPEAVFAELRRASAGGPADYAGISYERIAAEDGVFWPCPAADHPGTPRMFLEAFATPDGRARFVPVEHRPVAEGLDADYPVYFTTGRLLQHYQSGAQTRRVGALREAQPVPMVEVHPDLAQAHRLNDGDRIRVVSRRGAAAGVVRITETIRPDTVFMPFHWGGSAAANLVTNVLAGVTRPDSIELAGDQWYAEQGVALIAPAVVVSIDLPGQRVRLDNGQELPYDVLVLATGSSPVLPPVAGLVRDDGRLLPGAVAFRTLADCVAIDRIAANSGNAVVLGAGALGLETARGLAGRGLPVTLVQRGALLMERQLDAGASRVLTRTVRSFGVRVHAGVGVRAVRGDSQLRGVVLDDGSELEADLLVLCCGVRPRVELPREAGLAVVAGVVVDDQLRSSDPRVFAIGECAEHRGQTHGLAAPSWEQARVAAQVITSPGEPVSYAGSVTVTRLKAAGIELASLGEIATDDEETPRDATGPGGIEVIRFMDTSRGIYQKLVVRDGRLTGAILLGDTRTIGTITMNSAAPSAASTTSGI